VLTGVASVGFIGWTLATMPSPVAANPPSVAPPASSQSPTPSLQPRQSPVAAVHGAGANGGNADVARATATPQVSGSGRPHRSGSPAPTTPAPTTPVPTTPVPTTPVPTTPVPTTPVPTTPVPTTPVPTTPVPTTPVPTTPVPTTPVPTSPIGSLSPSAGPTNLASISVTPAPASLLVVQIVP
jgi:hypothetical protein